MFSASRLAVPLIVILTSHLFFPSSIFASQSKVKISAVLIQDRERTKACEGDFTKSIVDYAVLYKAKTFTFPCVVKTFSNTPLTGIQYLQINQGGEWVDICSVSFWADRVSRNDCAQKFTPTRNLGKLQGNKSWVNTYKKQETGSFDYSTLSTGRYTNTDGDFCYLTDIDNVELRVRVNSKSKDYYSNSFSFIYLNADKVIYKKNTGYGGTCGVHNLPASGEKPASQPTTGSSGTSLPQCNVTQIRSHAALAKSFNEFRSLYLRSTDEVYRAISGYEQAESIGSTYSMQRWLGLINEARVLARDNANEAISIQNKLISLMQECKFSYGIVISDSYGYITYDENVTGYKFPSFPLR